MTRNKRTSGTTDTKNFPEGRPSGIASPMNPAVPLEAGTDISQNFGADKPNPSRGLRPPTKGPHRRR